MCHQKRHFKVCTDWMVITCNTCNQCKSIKIMSFHQDISLTYLLGKLVTPTRCQITVNEWPYHHMFNNMLSALNSLIKRNCVLGGIRNKQITFLLIVFIHVFIDYFYIRCGQRCCLVNIHYFIIKTVHLYKIINTAVTPTNKMKWNYLTS